MIVAAIILGALVALQARINGDLGDRLGNGYLAAAISFAVGFAALTAATVITARGRSSLRVLARTVRRGSSPRWYFLGGVSGATLVLAQGLTAGLLGVALFTVSVVAGQTVSGLLVDRHGLGTMAATPVTWPRIAGTVLMVAAVIWAVGGDLGHASGTAWLVLPLCAGLLQGLQQAVNGQVRQITGSALIAAWNNFAVGLVVLVVVLAVHTAVRGLPHQLPPEPWLYLGGLAGVAFIAGTSIMVRLTGVLVLGLSAIAGQLIGSLLLDVLWPLPGRGLAWTTVAGTLLALVALGVTALPRRRR